MYLIPTKNGYTAEYNGYNTMIEKKEGKYIIECNDELFFSYSLEKIVKKWKRYIDKILDNITLNIRGYQVTLSWEEQEGVWSGWLHYPTGQVIDNVKYNSLEEAHTLIDKWLDYEDEKLYAEDMSLFI